MTIFLSINCEMTTPYFDVELHAGSNAITVGASLCHRFTSGLSELGSYFSPSFTALSILWFENTLPLMPVYLPSYSLGKSGDFLALSICSFEYMGRGPSRP